MKAKTLDGREIDLKQEALDSLKLRLKGPLLTAGDPGFEESRTVWNAMIDRRPAMVVRCLGTADVIACVRFARDHGLLLCIKGGGHNIAGLATADGALMLDMSLMRGVWVDPVRSSAHAQAGCLAGDLDRETQVHGLATVMGFISQTGIAGLTLGGGFGYLTRRWGWTADNVTGMDIVTADGRSLHASNSENPDLFWGLRGGGGNFGVVTGINYSLYQAGPEIVGGIIAWHASEAPEVLDFYRTFSRQAPPELSLAAVMRPAPPVPWLPPELTGKPIVALLACYSGKPEEGEKVVAPVKAFGKPVGDVIMRRPYTQLQSMFDTGQPKGRRYYWKSEYLAGIEPALCEKVILNAAKIPSPNAGLVFFQLGGALNHLNEGYSPAGNRNAHYVVNIMGSWEKPDEDGKNIDWVRQAWEDMKPYSTGGNYINFQTEDEDNRRIEAALGSGLRRLTEIKTKWDPDNFFRTNRNIKVQ